MPRSRLLLALVLLAPAARGDDWPQWRGPKNDGLSAETNLPTKWSATEGVAWKLPLPGPGASTPCVIGDKIVLTCVEGDAGLVLCVGTDGKEKWRKPLGSGALKTRGDEGGNLASASCSSDGKHVFAFVGTGQFAAFTLDGSPVWEKDVQKEYGNFRIQFGAHWTPALHAGRLFLHLGHQNAKLVVALDAATGKEVWKHTRTSDGVGEAPDVYASPFVWQGAGKALVIAHGNDYCTAHDVDTGAEVWRVTELNPKARYNRTWRAVSSPLVTPDLIVVPSCKRGVTVALDPTLAKGEVGPNGPGELWRLPKDTPDVSSPVRVGGYVYLMGEGGILYCHDAKTGAKVYEERITNMRHRANPVAADGKLYLQGRDKVLVVVKAGGSFEVLAKNELPDTFTASPAVSGGRLYLHGFGHLWAVGK